MPWRLDREACTGGLFSATTTKRLLRLEGVEGESHPAPRSYHPGGPALIIPGAGVHKKKTAENSANSERSSGVRVKFSVVKGV